MKKNITASLLSLAVVAAQGSKPAVRRHSALVLDSDTTADSEKAAAAAAGFVGADEGSGKGRRHLSLFGAKAIKEDLFRGAKSVKHDLLHLRGSKSGNNFLFSSKSSKGAKSHVCMAGHTGFTKIENDGMPGSENEQKRESKTIVQVKDLQVGDRVVGLNDKGIRTNECEVVSVINVGEATTFGNYTYEHFILSEDPDTLVMHGRDGVGRDATVYQVLSTCPVITDESGKESTFSLCARSLSGGERISWRDYVAVHGGILKLVRATGVRDLSALKSRERAVAYLPTLCTTGLTCARSGECDGFEAAMMTFARNELVPEALENVLTAFHMFGEFTKKSLALSMQ